MKVLLAEDEAIPRRLLEATVTRWGYDAVCAADGAEAWRILQGSDAPQLAIVDWLMPGMDGLEVCRQLRARGDAPYVYVLLLTARDSKEDIVEGLDAGADDYLTKPFDPQELRVRLRTGQRVVELESALRSSVKELADAREREAEIGGRIQRILLLGRPPGDLPAARVAVLSMPSQQVTGDFYDFREYEGGGLDVVVGDVMGKGVPAALLGAAVKNQLLRAVGRLASGLDRGKQPEPEQIVASLHSELTEQFIGLDFFVTLCYARIDTQRGVMTFVDCGHAKTIHRRTRTGECEMLEGENVPLGCSVDEVYRQVSRPFEPGDLFLFYSDGIPEAHSPGGEQFGTDRLLNVVRRHPRRAPEGTVAAVRQAVLAFRRTDTVADDLTCVAVEVGGPAACPVMSADDLEVTSHPSQLARIRAFVEEFCRRLPSPVAESAVQDVVLAVDEVAANVMRHAYHGHAGETIRLEAVAYPDHLALDVRHTGDPFDDSPPPRPPDGSLEGGFGLHIIRQCVDEVTYTHEADGGNRIHLVKALRAET